MTEGRMTSRRFAILFVDDEPENVQMLVRVLRGSYDVFGAASGAEGLELLRKHRIHAVIADQRMPEMTGLEFLHRVREANEEILLFMASGYLDLDLVIEATNRERIHGYFQKPLETSNLKMVLKREFDRYALFQQNRELLERTQIANRELQRLNDGKSDFLRLICRELQGTVEALGGAARLLESGKMPVSACESQRHLEILREEGARLSTLIKDLSYLLQAEGEDLKPRTEAVPLQQMLSILKDECVPHGKERRVVIDLEAPQGLAIRGDAEGISRALRNLFESSMRKAPEGGQIQVAARPGESVVEIRLSESWPAPKESGDGQSFLESGRGLETTEIGLFLARTMIEDQGGSMRCESVPGAGRVFVLSLPGAPRS